jgi:DNA invertase Pin-like site-specific DNA recombinase
MQAVVYARISKDRTGAKLGVDRQEQDCRELAAQLNWTVTEVFTDNDLSAYSGKHRPGYEAMCKALESGRAQAVIAWHADRLHRRPIELEDFIDLCDRKAIDVRTVKSGGLDFSDPSGKMVARMLGAAARHEVDHMVERAKRAKEQAAVAGKFRGGRRAFGYEKHGMETVPEEAAAIRAAAEAVLTGVSLSQIARQWNEQGQKTSYGGKEFTSKEVRKVLLRPRNAGIVLHEGKRIGTGQWAAILDRDTFAALEALLRNPSRRTSGGFERKYQGTGTYVCGRCGAKMAIAGQNYTQSHGWRRAYACSAAKHLVRDAEHLDNYIDQLVVRHLSEPDSALVLGGPSGDEVATLHAQREGLRTRKNDLAVMFADKEIDAEQLTSGTKEFRALIADIDTRLAAARAASAVANLVLAGDDLEATWAATSPDVRGKIIQELMTVTVLPSGRGRRPGGDYFDPHSIEICWRTTPLSSFSRPG